MKKIYVYAILCAICTLVSCNNANVQEPTDKEDQKEKTKNIDEYKKLLLGKWRQKSTVVYVKELENPEELEIPEDVAPCYIFTEDGILRRGNETIAYDSIAYELKGDTVKVSEANHVIELLTDESLIWICTVETGSVKEIFVRVK